MFLRGGYSTVVFASLIMSKLASTKKARSHCSKYLCIIIWITKSHISLAHMYSENKKMKNRNGRPNIKLCHITLLHAMIQTEVELTLLLKWNTFGF